MNLDEIGKKALEIGREIIQKYAREGFEVEWKADRTPVTIADQKAEEEMRAFLLKEMNCGIIGEEHGAENTDRDYVWILDPIDGTKSFTRGVPLYGSLLACLYQGKPIWGAIDLSALGQSLTAELGQGAFLNGQKVKVSQVDSMDQACLVTGTVNTFAQFGKEDAFNNLRKSCGLYRGWGDCYGYFLTLTGRADLMVDPVVSLWDIAPMPVLFAECGGSFSNLKGQNFSEMLPDLKNWKMSSDNFDALGSNGLLHYKTLDFF